uniref:AAA+ ATPase domain-containing protein n=1 Tax=Trypanosoma vivax (strain Y486) TaxID=1055687 RepID=G0UD41_TRYVY|nr:conserved hypothetical protein [Trypanosoma vivax Y486]
MLGTTDVEDLLLSDLGMTTAVLMVLLAVVIPTMPMLCMALCRLLATRCSFYSFVRRAVVWRTITGTFYRRAPYNRPVLKGKCDHSGILLNALLLYISKRVCGLCAGETPYFKYKWHGGQSVAFLFDPLKSDAELVLGKSSFEPLGFFHPDVSFRALSAGKQLQRYTVTRLPTAGSWIWLGDGVEVTYQRRRVDDSEGQRVDHILHFRSCGNDAEARLQRVVEKSLQEYREVLGQEGARQQFFFQIVESENKLRFHKRPLTTTKTFDTIFFPQKRELLERLDMFMGRRGRYAVDGFPHKMGLLIQGGPETGKTSLVSALATYTGRHVISLHLPLVSTDQQLNDIVLNCVLYCFGDSEPFVFDPSQVIFLFDDVDPSDEVVRQRLPSHSDCSLNGVMTTNINGVQKWLGEQDGEKKRTLSLSGLLNVLDGVVSMGSAIFVMCTRDPSGIDAALIRPGRFGYQIHMGNIGQEEVIELLQLYYGEEQTRNTSGLQISSYRSSRCARSETSKSKRCLHDEDKKRLITLLQQMECRKIDVRMSDIQRICLTNSNIDDFFKVFGQHDSPAN